MEKIKIAIISETVKELKTRNKILKVKRAILMGFPFLSAMFHSIILYF
jgi:hypothetical protein